MAIRLSLLLVLLTAAVYAQSLGFGFISFDDPLLIENNPMLGAVWSTEFVSWAFTTSLGGNWNPLVWFSFALDYQLFGMSAGGYHATNLLLHLANTLLLFHLLRQASGELFLSFWVAALFAVHPQHVEAVAWVTARKDLLSTLFGLLAIQAYTGASGKHGMPLACIGSMALSLMAKPMFVTLPFLLVVLDLWPLRRIDPGAGPGQLLPALGRSLLQKWPLLLLTILGCAIAWMSHETEGAISDIDLGLRLQNVVVAYCFYLQKTVLPLSLSIFYPLNIPSPGHVAAGSLLLLGISIGAWKTRQRAPYLLVGWLWYLGTLVPVSGIIPFGGHAFADRFSYVPRIGLLLALVWGAAHLARKPGFPVRRAALAGASVLLVLGGLTAIQVSHWKDSLTMFRHTERVVEADAFIYSKISQAYAHRGAWEEALEYNLKALEVAGSNDIRMPGLMPLLLRGNGLLLYQLGEYRASEYYLQEALALRPGDAKARDLLLLVRHKIEEDGQPRTPESSGSRKSVDESGGM